MYKRPADVLFCKITCKSMVVDLQIIFYSHTMLNFFNLIKLDNRETLQRYLQRSFCL